MKDHAKEVSVGDNGLRCEEIVGGELDSRLEMVRNFANGFWSAHAWSVLDDEGEIREGFCNGEGDVALVATHLAHITVSIRLVKLYMSLEGLERVWLTSTTVAS